MFGNNNDDETDSTDDEPEYTIYDREGDVWDHADSQKEAKDLVEHYEEFHPDWTPFHAERKTPDGEVDEETQDALDEAGEMVDDTFEGDLEDDLDDLFPTADELWDEGEPEPEPVAEAGSDAPYGFVSAEGRSARYEVADNPEPVAVTKWRLGSHSQGTDEMMETSLAAMLENLDPAVDSDLRNVLSDASQMLHGTGISGFECPVCGLNHGHSDAKHDIREAFNVSVPFAEEMEYCPYCHCGANEMAMLIDFYGHIEMDVFDDAYLFETVDKLRAETVDDLTLEFSRTQSVRNACEFAGVDVDEHITAFFDRYQNIKQAASSAPISQETQTDIDDLRDVVEAAVHE